MTESWESNEAEDTVSPLRLMGPVVAPRIYTSVELLEKRDVEDLSLAAALNRETRVSDIILTAPEM
jgi:hypothetical protein